MKTKRARAVSSSGTWMALARGTLAVALASRLAAGESTRPPDPTPEASRSGAERERTGAERAGLGGHVLPALARASKVGRATSEGPGRAPLGPALENLPITLTVILARDDERGFRRYLVDLYDPRSPLHGRYLTPEEVADRFGPSSNSYAAVHEFLRARGFDILDGSDNRLTLTVSGTRGQAEDAFGVEIGEYELAGRPFYANDRDPTLPAELAPRVQAIVGLNDLPRPESLSQLANCLQHGGGWACLKNFVGEIWKAYSETNCGTRVVFFVVAFLLLIFFAEAFVLASTFAYQMSLFYAALYSSALSCALGSLHPRPDQRAAVSGAGQKIGLLQYDSFHLSDVRDYLALNAHPASQLAQLTEVKVNGGAPLPPGPGETEVLLDVAVVMTMAPGAWVVVYDAPFSTSFQTLLNRMVNDGMTVISNSWAYCEDQTTLADAQSLDSVLAGAAASGISVFNAAGDTGSTCLDGTPLTLALPAACPSATAVGGATVLLDDSLLYQSASWWQDAGGHGTSRFFPRPAYQNGFTASPMRSVPDVVAPADPVANGLGFCQASAGGCPSGLLVGGTSMAAPIWAGHAALLNESLGQNLGFLNPRLYPLAATSSFRSPASMGSDFAHVGLGLPNQGHLALQLAGQSPGLPDAGKSFLAANPTNVAVRGASTTGRVIVQLRDAKGFAVGGKTVSLQKSGGSASIAPPTASTSPSDGTAVFTVSDTVIEDVTFTALDVSDNVTVTQTARVSFVAPPATQGGIAATPTSVAPDDFTTISVTLRDAGGQGVAGKLVRVLQGTGRSIVTAVGDGRTDANGLVTFTAVDHMVESVTYTAVDVTDGNLAVPGSVTVDFNAQSSCTLPDTPPVVSGGFSFRRWATGFPIDPTVFGCIGPMDTAWSLAGEAYVTTFAKNSLYRIPPEGGNAAQHLVVTYGPDPAHGNLPPCPVGIAFSRDGRHLYMARSFCNPWGQGDVVEIDPATGAVKRVLADLPYPLALRTDPLSGDLFVSQGITPPGLVYRISSPEGTPTLSTYASPGAYGTELAFAPDGALHMVGGGFGPRFLVQISGTSWPTPGVVTPLADVPDLYGLGLATAAGSSSVEYVLGNTTGLGTLTKVDLTQNPPVVSDVLTGGTSGEGNYVTVGPDGCFYANQTDSILRISKADGSCPLGVPSGASPGIALEPTSVTPDPPQGSPVAFTARLRNVASPAGTPILFAVAGANTDLKSSPADASGSATFTYGAAKTGTDGVTATATVNGVTLAAGPVRVTWGPGRHTTELDLGTGPGGVTFGGAAALQATLTDLSATPPVPIPGATVSFSIGGQTCSGVTSAGGVAACGFVPSTPGLFALTADYAGDGGHLPSRTSRPFQVFVLGSAYGDLDQNGERDVFDVVILASAIVGNVAPGTAPFTAARHLADLNRDGVIDVFDLVLLQGFLVGNVPALPV